MKTAEKRIAYVALISLLVLIMAPAPAPAARQRLVIATWGGIWGNSLERHVLEGFRKEYDVDIVIHRQTNAADTLAKLRAEKNKPTIDIYFGTSGGAYAMAKEGIAAELTGGAIPNLVDVSPLMLGRLGNRAYWVGVHLMTRGLTVRKDLVKVPDKVTFKWLESPELKGKIAFPPFSLGLAAILLHLAKANGGDENNVEPGFQAARRIAPNVRVIYSTSGDAVRLLTTGEVAVAHTNTAGAAETKKTGVDVGFYLPEDAPVMLSSDAVIVVKGGPAGPDLAFKFLEYLLDPRRITVYSYQLGVNSPNIRSTSPTLTLVPFPITRDQLSKGWWPDPEVVTANYEKWQERWQREVIPLMGR